MTRGTRNINALIVGFGDREKLEFRIIGDWTGNAPIVIHRQI